MFAREYDGSFENQMWNLMSFGMLSLWVHNTLMLPLALLLTGFLLLLLNTQSRIRRCSQARNIVPLGLPCMILLTVKYNTNCIWRDTLYFSTLETISKGVSLQILTVYTFSSFFHFFSFPFFLSFFIYVSSCEKKFIITLKSENFLS